MEALKLELIRWILSLKKKDLLEKVLKMKAQLDEESILPQNTNHPTRTFGGGKGIFTYISGDFDAPLEDFNEYMH